MKDRAVFVRNLRRWTPYVLLNAAPSFIAAYGVEFNRPQSVVGMLAGVAVFLALYVGVWSSAWFRRWAPEGSPWSRALLYATWGRSALGILGFIGVLISLHSRTQNHPSAVALFFLAFLLPDLFSGFASGFFISWAVQSPLVRAVRVMIGGPNAHERYQSLAVGDVNSLVPTFITTLAQGILLTLMLLLFALACRGVMWLSARWKARRMPAGNVATALT